MKEFVLCFLMLMTASSSLRADPVTFEATINSTRVSLDEVLQLTLTVTGVNKDLDPVSLPVLDGFSAKYIGPSTSVSIVNGDYHSERSFIYNLFPNKAGKFQIPPITATIEGQAYTTQPIDVEVFENTAQAQAPGGAADQGQAPTAESLKDKIFIMVSVAKTRVYLGERVPVSIKLLVNGVLMRDIQYPQFDKTGFTADDFDKASQASEVFNGVKYDTVEFKTSVYPAHLGDLALGPVQVQGNVLYKAAQSNPFGQDNPFGADFFSNFTDAYATRPVVATSQPIHLHVLPLPGAGRPDDFSGAIGQSFDFQASVAPAQVKAGDPLTLKMTVTGNGDLKSLKIPVFQASGFKTYDPQIKSTGDQKIAEEVIIPTSAGINEVPALHFSYFDTSINDYKTITQGPFAIQVASPSPDQDFKAVGFADVGRESPALPVSQSSFRNIFNGIRQVLGKLFRSLWFWLSTGFVLLAGGAYFLWQGFQKRLENDPAFARRFKAVREARQALTPAEGYISAGKIKDLYALLSKVLRDYLANKWHQSSAALSVAEISGRLKTARTDEAVITQVKAVLEQSDLVCFAGANRDADQMKADLAVVRDAIAHLEKSLK